MGGIVLGDFKNGTLMFVLGGCIMAFVLAQSVFFLVKAWREARRMGIESRVLKKTVISSAVFSIAPSFSILVGLLALTKALGVALPWIRLSVLGAVTYELPAATAAASAFGISINDGITDPKVFAAVAWVMTLGCITPMIIIPLFLKKIQKGLDVMKNRDKKWGDICMTALFLGMIAAFLGMGVSGGLVSILTLVSSALIMGVCGLIIKKGGVKWLQNYAIPFSMIGAMGLAILFNQIA